jgi:hypothetical protein
MPDAILGWKNAVLSGALVASSEAAGLDAGQLQNQHGSAAYAWQTAASVTSANLRIDGGAGAKWRAFGLFRTNLTPAATVRWRVSDDSAFATSIYDSGTLSGTVIAGYAQSLAIATTEQTGRYARVDIADAGNPDGFLNIPLAYAGPVLQPAVGLAYGTRHARDRDEVVVRSRGGQEFVTLRSARRRWGFDFGALTTAEFWDGLAELDRVAADGTNVLLVPFPAGSNVAREAVFGRLAFADDATWPAPNEAGLRRFAGTITERL